jgi:hypothetical protein
VLRIRAVGPKAREPVVIVHDIEFFVLWNHRSPGEDIHAKPFILPTHFREVERAADVVPGKRADQPVVTVGHLLPPDFCRERELLVVAGGDISLMQIHRVRLGTFALAPDGSGHGWRVRIGKALVTLREAGVSLDERPPPFVGVTSAQTDPFEKIVVVHVGTLVAEVNGSGDAGMPKLSFTS